MPLLHFTLSEGGISDFHDVLNCLQKFSDNLCLDVRSNSFVLTTFNSTKSAYARFTFDPTRFFSNYHFDATSQRHGRFYCIMGIHTLLPIFVKRSMPSAQAGFVESSIDRCDVTIEDDVGKHSRFIAKVVKKNGISATHRLPFENLPPVHAKFDKDAAVNVWAAPARNLRQLLDHFGPGTELLDIHLDETDPDDEDAEGVINFTCFTEKTVSGDQVLKKPLHTSIAVSAIEFTEMSMEEKLHITITVKDFKSIIYHATLVNSDVTARFSTPAKPMHLSYRADGFEAEFLLMTVGERNGDGARKKKSRQNGARSERPVLDMGSRVGSVARSTAPPKEPTVAIPTPRASSSRPSVAMPPPGGTPAMSAVVSRVSGSAAPRSQAWKLRPSNVTAHPPRSNIESDSLFVTQDEDDESRWEPVNDEDDDDDNTPAWGGSNIDMSNNGGPPLTMNRVSMPNPTNIEAGKDDGMDSIASGLDPTQRLTEVQKFGLFG